MSTVHAEMRAYLKTAGLLGVSVVGGCDQPHLIGDYWYALTDAQRPDLRNGQPSYTNGYFRILWTGTAWQITSLDGLTSYFTRTDPVLAGAFASGGTLEVMVQVDPLRPYRYLGDGSQVVVAPFRVTDDEAADRFATYGCQIAYYLPSMDEGRRDRDQFIAEQRAQGALAHFRQFKGRTNGAPGLTLTGWSAQFVDVEDPGFIDQIPLKAGFLLKALCIVLLRNVSVNP